MFKRLISWLYERYCEPKEYSPLDLSPAEFLAAKKRYEDARLIAKPFMYAAWHGLPKPPHSLDASDNIIRVLDSIYERNKPKESVLFNRPMDA